ncbi:MAG: O-antigen ligase family protein, partial [Patescibacteria group bacterium]
QKKVWRVAAGFVVVVILFGGVFWTTRNSSFVRANPVLSRFASISLNSQNARFLIWGMAWRGFEERPILGWGPDNYVPVFNKYYHPGLYAQEQWFDRAHNVFFDWLIAGGILGLAAYLSLFITSFYCLWKKVNRFTLGEKSLWTGLLAGYFVHNFFVFDNLVSLVLFFAFLGYLHFRTTETTPDRSFPEKRKVSPLIVIPVALFLVYALNAKPLLAAKGLLQALVLTGQGAAVEALEKFEKIIDYQTVGRAEAREQMIFSTLQLLGNEKISSSLKQDLVVRAEKQVQAMVAADPKNARPLILAGNFFGALGQTDRALDYFIAAKKFSPQKQTIRFGLVKIYLARGDVVLAKQEAQEAYELEPHFSEAATVYALTAILTKDLVLADNILTTAFGENIPPDDRLINAYVAAGQYDRVVELWQNKVALEPENIKNREALIGAYIIVGNRTKAITEAEAIIKLKPELTKQYQEIIKVIRSGKKIEVNGKLF